MSYYVDFSADPVFDLDWVVYNCYGEPVGRFLSKVDADHYAQYWNSNY